MCNIYIRSIQTAKMSTVNNTLFQERFPANSGPITACLLGNDTSYIKYYANESLFWCALLFSRTVVVMHNQ